MYRECHNGVKFNWLDRIYEYNGRFATEAEVENYLLDEPEPKTQDEIWEQIKNAVWHLGGRAL